MRVAEKRAGARLVRYCAAVESAINREFVLTPLKIKESIAIAVTGRPAAGSDAAEDYLGGLPDERIRNDRVVDRS